MNRQQALEIQIWFAMLPNMILHPQRRSLDTHAVYQL
jgi:hypothetical protein